MSRRTFRSAACIVLLGLAILMASGAAQGASKVAGSIGKAAPALKLKDIDGKAIVVDQNPRPVVLIDFWQTSCPPCHKLAPHLQRFHQTYGSKGLKVIGVALGDSVKKVRDYANSAKLTYSMAIDMGTLANAFGVSATPTVVIIDSRGIIRHVEEGFADGLGIETKMETVIRDLLGLK